MQENLIGTTCKWPPLALRDMKLYTVNITFRGIRSLEYCYSFAFGWRDNFWGTKSICKAKYFRSLTCTRLTSATVRRITWIPLVRPCNICDTKFWRNFTLFLRSGFFFCVLPDVSCWGFLLKHYRIFVIIFPNLHRKKLAKNRVFSLLFCALF